MTDNDRTPVPPDESMNAGYSYQNPTAPMGEPTTPINTPEPEDPFGPTYDAASGADAGAYASYQSASTQPPYTSQPGSYASRQDAYASQPSSYAASTQVPFTDPAQAVADAAKANKPAKEKSGRLGNVVSAIIGAVVASALFIGVWSFTPLGAKTGAVSDQSVNATTGEVTINSSGETTVAEAVAAKCLNSVVTIYVYSDDTSAWSKLFGGSSSSSSSPNSLGSGVIVKEDSGTYYIVTNYHVVEGASRAVVKIGDEQYEATLVGSDEKTDLAVISVKATGLTVANWGDSSSLNIGEWVAAIGAPYGYEQSLSTGIVSALYRTDTISSSSGLGSTVYTDMIQTDAAINPGNSGGGLFNSEGQLVGINTYITSTSQASAGLGFAIPQSYAQGIVDNIISGEAVQHPMLGVSMGAASEDGGVAIAAVYKGTAAEAAGLHTGDVITKIGDKAITKSSEVTEAVRSHKVGDKVSITYKRDGEEKTVEVTLGADTDAQDEYAEGGEPAQNNGNSGGRGWGNSGNNGGNGSGGNSGNNGDSDNGFGGGSDDDWYYGFDLEDLFGGNPFSFGEGSNSWGN